LGHKLPPLLQGFGAVPPLVTDIDLSMDDRFLYVACWGTGEMRQYDVNGSAYPLHEPWETVFRPTICGGSALRWA
jgi:hypothetical protein